MDHGKTGGSLLNARCAGTVVAAVPAAFLGAFAGDTPASTGIDNENRGCPWIERRRSLRQFARRTEGDSRSLKCEAAHSFFGNLRNRTGRLRTGSEKFFKRSR